MKYKDFYQSVIVNEVTAVDFLKQHGLLPEEEEEGSCIKCGQDSMKATNRRRQDSSLRCSNRKCQTFRSVRSGNPFFHWRDKNDNCRFRLSLCEILEIVFLWSHRTSSQHAIEAEEEEGSCIAIKCVDKAFLL